MKLQVKLSRKLYEMVMSVKARYNYCTLCAIEYILENCSIELTPSEEAYLRSIKNMIYSNVISKLNVETSCEEVDKHVEVIIDEDLDILNDISRKEANLVIGTYGYYEAVAKLLISIIAKRTLNLL